MHAYKCSKAWRNWLFYLSYWVKSESVTVQLIKEWKWKVKESENEVFRSCLTLCDHIDCSLQGSSIHGIFQARVLEWGAVAFSTKNYQSRAYNFKITEQRTDSLKEISCPLVPEKVTDQKTILKPYYLPGLFVLPNISHHTVRLCWGKGV